MEIGSKIRQFRMERNMTQEEVANALNLSAQAVSKWENGLTMPDIQLLPELAMMFGTSIDALFSITDESRMERIENMICHKRFLDENDFEDAEKFLKAKMLDEKSKPRAVLLMAHLYVKRGREYLEKARPLAREALLLNPEEKWAHNAVFDAESVPCRDWNEDNRWELIAFYQEFLRAHPDNPRSYGWLLDLLCESGRTQEMRPYVEKMDALEHSFRTDYYLGRIAKEEGNIAQARIHWSHMVEEFPDEWCAWSLLGDCMAYCCEWERAIECYQKSMDVQKKPRYMDNPVAMAQIAEIRGDIRQAIRMRELCITMTEKEWGVTEGEWIDAHRREIERLKKQLNS